MIVDTLLMFSFHILNEPEFFWKYCKTSNLFRVTAEARRAKTFWWREELSFGKKNGSWIAKNSKSSLRITTYCRLRVFLRHLPFKTYIFLIKKGPKRFRPQYLASALRLLHILYPVFIKISGAVSAKFVYPKCEFSEKVAHTKCSHTELLQALGYWLHSRQMRCCKTHSFLSKIRWGSLIFLN